MLDPFRAVLFPNGFFQQETVPCHPGKEQLEEDDKEFKMLT